MSDDKDDLVGFKDLIGSNDIKIDKPKKSTRFDNFENLTFLDQESDRLNSLIDLFEYKMSNLKQFPQDIALSIQQETLNIDLQENISSIMIEEGSVFEKKMEYLFDSFFRK